MFRTLLVANRGEIARRVMRTARRLGVRTIAVYSDADADAAHVAEADQALRIGPPSASESYLLTEALLEAAKRGGAEALHPGYGFLSESPELAEACAAHGVVFVGPPAEAMRAMAEKDAAKRLLSSAGVPVVPGFHEPDADERVFARMAAELGYPVLIKAVAGGGGRGMRRVDEPDALAGALASARRESAAAFGDERVLLEKLLVRPRHVEVQVFADHQGQVVHLFERDCSLQRRHQKVVEEAPAPSLSSALRQALAEAAVRAARAIGYRNAGTVEFLVDVAQGESGEPPYYFIEMNTRLQVEHPVTEMITGLDLVEWQLRVAADEPLPLAQDEIRLAGHAIEVRLYAEDPARDFAPASGALDLLRFPEANERVRIESGFREGDAVSVHYDALLAKLIVHGEDRNRAVKKLANALADLRVGPVATNLALLRGVATHPAFAAAELDTAFLERHRGELVATGAVSRRALASACLHVLLEREQQARERSRSAQDAGSPWHLVDGWHLNDWGRDRLVFEDGEIHHELWIRFERGERYLVLPDGELPLAGERTAEGSLRVQFGPESFRADVVGREAELVVLLAEGVARLRRSDVELASGAEEMAIPSVSAPMPGRITRLLVQSGERVRRGQPLAVLEAMKMEQMLLAPMDGVVSSIRCAEGEQVEEGVALFVIDPPEEPEQ